jgi:tetratricopeptide (TPR) repeat protein
MRRATYNQEEVTTQHPSRGTSRSGRWLFRLACLATLLSTVNLAAQSLDTQGLAGRVAAEPGSGHILLVLPFDNLTPQSAVSASAQTATQTASQAGQPTGTQSNVDWLREAVPEILNDRFISAGFAPLTREDRLYALDHLGLPEGFQPSRATALRLAQTLDADAILFGSYSIAGTTLTLKARIVDVGKLTLSPEVTQSGELDQLIPLLNSLAWQLTRKLDPSFNVAEETFRAAGSKIRLDAFEQYVRGITEREPQERLRHLKKATDLSPDFTAAWLATGKLQFASQQYEDAAVSFAKVTKDDPSDLEAGFYRGLSLMFSGGYPRAEEAFAAIARVLPLPEVVNNEAVAISRRGHDSVALFRQAVAADPTDPDYHFNLAVSLHRHGDKAEAQTELAQTLRLRPNDSEAKALDLSWKSVTDSSAEPLERIKRSYDGAAFRQAAMVLDQVEAARIAALPASERAAKLAASAHEKLDRGLLLESERGFQAAITADDHSAAAHVGLAQVRERAGDSESARREAKAALDRQPNPDAYLVLARLDLAANRLDQARDEADEALRLDPASRSGKDLHKSIESRIEASAAKPSPAKKP